MFGYVTADKPEMKVKEYELYRAYYCGICKSLGRNYGQTARMCLSYDLLLLALLISSIDDETENVSLETCALHHIKKRAILGEKDFLRYAGEVTLVMAYYKMLDDYNDEHNLKSLILSLFFKKYISKIKKKEEKLCQLVEDNLKELGRLEKENSPELDRAADYFGQIMRYVFERGATYSRNGDDRVARIFGHIGYFLGKWIYLMDAYEDIEENIESGSYNPLLHRFGYDREKESTEDFRIRIKSDVEFSLMNCLGEISNGLELADIKKNKGILDNIVYLGLRRKTEAVLLGKEKNAGLTGHSKEKNE